MLYDIKDMREGLKLICQKVFSGRRNNMVSADINQPSR